tara:strand:- start:1551 stop:1814 length:264 start_codon:yes stop_codon:yes gene_type:complete
MDGGWAKILRDREWTIYREWATPSPFARMDGEMKPTPMTHEEAEEDDARDFQEAAGLLLIMMEPNKYTTGEICKRLKNFIREVVKEK